MMRNLLLGVLLVTATVPAFAADAPAVKRGTMLRDANNVRLGTVDSVRPDGSVGVIVASRYVIVPAASLASVDGKLVTKLTKKEVTAIK